MVSKKTLIFAGMVLAAILLCFWGGLVSKQKTAGPLTGLETGQGQQVPSFELSNQNGKLVQVPEGIQGQAIYLIFFSTG